MSSLSCVDSNVEGRQVMPFQRATRPPFAVQAKFDLDVGVIYSGERQFMAPLVTSIAGSGTGLALRLILVDNASPDGVSRWTHLCSHTKIVTNSQSRGYAANLNRILAASDARYTLLLNTDMFFDVEAQCLARMVRFMDDNPRCGLSICQILHPDGTYASPARRFPSWRAIAGRRLGMGRLFPRAVGEHLYQDRDPTSSFSCDWVSGCFMLVRREAIQEIGSFDEGYIKYFEDVDICGRMGRAGWKVMFHGGTHCFHYEQRASRKTLSRDAWLHGRAYLRWLLKSMFSRPVAQDHDTPEAHALPSDAQRRAEPPAPHFPASSERTTSLRKPA